MASVVVVHAACSPGDRPHRNRPNLRSSSGRSRFPVVFRHVVLLSIDPTAGDDAPEQIVTALRSLPSVIPELRAYVVGRDAGMAPDNSTIAVVADFDDEAGYLAYRDHPEHQRVIAELIRPVLLGRSAVQHLVP